MAHEIDGNIWEVRLDEGEEVFKALSSTSRRDILRLLADSPLNVNEISTALGISQPMVTKHIQQLEQAGLILTEYVAGTQGMQKRSRLRYKRVIVDIEPDPKVDERVDQLSMPIGLYTLVHPHGTCGLASRSNYIGLLDRPQSFYEPERVGAEILWMANGFVEYTFPNSLPSSMEVDRLEVSMEICSEAPDYNNDWPSDITLWVNNVEVGTWTCSGDFGGRRGLHTPDWWPTHMTQYGLLKVWMVTRTASFIDGQRVSDVNLDRLMIVPQEPLTIRIGVKPDAEHQGGFNLFGRGFGNYAQDLLLRLHFSRKPTNSRLNVSQGEKQ